MRVLVDRFGQTGLATGGGVLLALAYVTLAFEPRYWIAPFAIVAIGLGFYMLHNTLQTNATQMTPEARGTAVVDVLRLALSGTDRGRRLAAASCSTASPRCRCSWARPPCCWLLGLVVRAPAQARAQQSDDG